jgi:hypothetical protein
VPNRKEFSLGFPWSLLLPSSRHLSLRNVDDVDTLLHYFLWIPFFTTFCGDLSLLSVYTHPLFHYFTVDTLLHYFHGLGES